MIYQSEGYIAMALALAQAAIMKRPTMEFPSTEHESLRKRLKERQPIYTTRVSDDFNKFKLGKKYITNITIEEHNLARFIVEVVKVQELHDVQQHPFYSELTEDQKKELIKAQKYKVLTLKFVGSKIPQEKIHKVEEDEEK